MVIIMMIDFSTSMDLENWVFHESFTHVLSYDNENNYIHSVRKKSETFRGEGIFVIVLLVWDFALSDVNNNGG